MTEDRFYCGWMYNPSRRLLLYCKLLGSMLGDHEIFMSYSCAAFLASWIIFLFLFVARKRPSPREKRDVTPWRKGPFFTERVSRRLRLPGVSAQRALMPDCLFKLDNQFWGALLRNLA